MVSLPAYDTSKVQSLSLTPNGQLGYVEGVGSWTASSLPITADASGPDRDIGFSFDFSVNNDSERGLALAPRIPFTAATDDLAGTGETADYWTLTISTSLTGLTGVVARLYAVQSATPSAWSGSTNTPRTNITTLNETFYVGQFSNSASEWTLNGSTYDLVLNLDFHTTYAEGSTRSGSILRPFHTIVNNAAWTGLLQFVFSASGVDIPVTAITFAGYTHKWHTGLSGAEPRRRGRAVHDYITGQPYLSDAAVPDGYRDGIMVHPDNYDPEDPLDTDFFTPPPGEGVTDDEVNNLE